MGPEEPRSQGSPYRGGGRGREQRRVRACVRGCVRGCVCVFRGGGGAWEGGWNQDLEISPSGDCSPLPPLNPIPQKRAAPIGLEVSSSITRWCRKRRQPGCTTQGNRMLRELFSCRRGPEIFRAGNHGSLPSTGLSVEEHEGS